MRDEVAVEVADRIIRTMTREILGPSTFAECVRWFSTARLQEMRRIVNAELAGRMAPREDLRDERAIRAKIEADLRPNLRATLDSDRGKAGRT